MDNEVDPPLAEGLLKPYLELDLVVKARLFGRGFHVEVDVATAAVIVNPASKQADLRVEGGDEDLAFTALEGVCDLAGELQREPLMHHAQRQPPVASRRGQAPERADGHGRQPLAQSAGSTNLSTARV